MTAPSTALPRVLEEIEAFEFWRARRAELLEAENLLWDKRDSLIDQRTDGGEVTAGEIEQLAQAAIIVCGYAELASLNAYPMVASGRT